MSETTGRPAPTLLALVLTLALLAACSRDDEPKPDTPLGSSGEVVSAVDEEKPDPAPVVTGGSGLAAPSEGYGGTGRGASQAPSASGSAGVSAMPARTASRSTAPRRIGSGDTRSRAERAADVVTSPPAGSAAGFEIPPGPGSPPPAAVDTARGRVAVVGAVPFTRVELRPSGGFPLTLTGELEEELRGLAGVELWAGGRRTVDGALDVMRYVVLRVDGRPAIDGRLVSDTAGLYVETIAGTRHRIASPPESLREHVGSRVWITGDPAAGITAYGVVRVKQ